jgi:hypothetical protein
MLSPWCLHGVINLCASSRRACAEFFSVGKSNTAGEDVIYSVVTVLLQFRYSVVTVVLQCNYSVVTVLLQCFHSVVRSFSAEVGQTLLGGRPYLCVTLLLHCCCTVVTLLLHCWYTVAGGVAIKGEGASTRERSAGHSMKED